MGCLPSYETSGGASSLIFLFLFITQAATRRAPPCTCTAAAHRSTAPPCPTAARRLRPPSPSWPPPWPSWPPSTCPASSGTAETRSRLGPPLVGGCRSISPQPSRGSL
ncbi:MAG: hypothetical protein J3K34DRAFT_422146, partial [Monoraphidium minutum]